MSNEIEIEFTNGKMTLSPQYQSWYGDDGIQIYCKASFEFKYKLYKVTASFRKVKGEWRRNGFNLEGPGGRNSYKGSVYDEVSSLIVVDALEPYFDTMNLDQIKAQQIYEESKRVRENMERVIDSQMRYLEEKRAELARLWNVEAKALAALEAFDREEEVS